MKRIAFLFIGILVALSSCQKSNEDKINEVVSEIVKSNLYYPESYDPIDTSIDSAMTPFDDPVFIEQITKVQKQFDKVDRLKSVCDNTRNAYLKYKNDYFKQDYLQAKTEYEEELAKADKADQKIIDRLNGKKEFIGFFVNHRFRAKTNSGAVDIANIFIILDKNYKAIYGLYKNEEEYILFEKYMKELNEESDEE